MIHSRAERHSIELDFNVQSFRLWWKNSSELLAMVFNSKFLQIFIINFLAVTKNDDRPFEKKFLAFSTSQVHPQKNWTPTKKKLKKKELKKTKIFFFSYPCKWKVMEIVWKGEKMAILNGCSLNYDPFTWRKNLSLFSLLNWKQFLVKKTRKLRNSKTN